VLPNAGKSVGDEENGGKMYVKMFILRSSMRGSWNISEEGKVNSGRQRQKGKKGDID